MIPTLASQRSDADICRANGWTAGTQLHSDDGWLETVIEITAIGEESILAKVIRQNRTSPRIWGKSRRDREWSLKAQQWSAVSP